MPLYAYICKKCGHEFEEMQKFSDPPVKKCPKCKGAVAKKITAAGFQLKGAGWYKDGYSKASGEKKAESPKATDAKPAAVKTESKAEKK